MSRMDPIRFTLYVAGSTPRSQQAVLDLERIGREVLADRFEMAVVDVTEDPEAAERARILTTPTLVKETPPPARRVTGDLSDTRRVLAGLALPPRPDRGPHAKEHT